MGVGRWWAPLAFVFFSLVLFSRRDSMAVAFARLPLRDLPLTVPDLRALALDFLARLRHLAL